MTSHSWHCPDLTPFSTGVMTCRRCRAVTNNAFLADLYPCPEPAVTDDTPMEAGPLDDNPSRLKAASTSLAAKRREMKRHYAPPAISSGQCKGCDQFGSLYFDSGYCARCYEEVHQVVHIGRPEPVLEHSGFAPRSEDDAQAEFLAKRDRVKDSFWQGVTVGAVVALLGVIALTGVILAVWR